MGRNICNLGVKKDFIPDLFISAAGPSNGKLSNTGRKDGFLEEFWVIVQTFYLKGGGAETLWCSRCRCSG